MAKAHVNGEQFTITFLLIVNFFAPIGLTFLAVGAFVLLDTIFGWYKFKKVKQHTSKGARMGILSKTLFYFVFIGCVHIMDRAFMDEFVRLFFNWNFAITKLMGFVLIWIECISIGENYKAIHGVSILEVMRKFLRGGAELAKGFRKIKGNDSES